jgi:hypothetical protein
MNTSEKKNNKEVGKYRAADGEINRLEKHTWTAIRNNKLLFCSFET